MPMDLNLPYPTCRLDVEDEMDDDIATSYVKYEEYRFKKGSEPKEPTSYVYPPVLTNDGKLIAREVRRTLRKIKKNLKGRNMRQSQVTVKDHLKMQIGQFINNFVTVTIAFHTASQSLRTDILKNVRAFRTAGKEIRDINTTLRTTVSKQLKLSRSILVDAEALRRGTDETISITVRIAIWIVERNLGEIFACIGAVFALIVSMIQLLGGKQLELVVYALTVVACIFSTGPLLKHIPCSQQNLEATIKAMDNVDVSAAKLIDIFARIDLYWRQGAVVIAQYQSSNSIEVLSYLDVCLDWHIRVANAMLKSHIMEFTLNPPSVIEVEEERRWFVNEMA
ncbi:hypothetical protein CPB86DRAFT_795771 [Serendipita vermifera]|nr:hypothetical protein CPB86DRAFT_795771 [Serendipita vermifera]